MCHSAGRCPRATSLGRTAQGGEEARCGVARTSCQCAIGPGVRRRDFRNRNRCGRICARCNARNGVRVYPRSIDGRIVVRAMCNAAGSGPCTTCIRTSTERGEHADRSALCAHGEVTVGAGIRRRVDRHRYSGTCTKARRYSRYGVRVYTSGIDRGIHRATMRCATGCGPRTTGIRTSAKRCEQRCRRALVAKCK